MELDTLDSHQLEKLNERFSLMKNTHVQICEFHFFYFEEILIKISSDKDIFFIHLNQVGYFKGDLQGIANNLSIEYKDEIFEIKDSFNNFCIKCKQIDFRENVEPVF